MAYLRRIASLAALSAPLVSCTSPEEAFEMMKRVCYLPNFTETRDLELDSNTLLYVYTQKSMQEKEHTQKLLKGVEGASTLKYTVKKWYYENSSQLDDLNRILKMPREELGLRLEGGGGLFYVKDSKAYALPGGVGVHEVDSWINKVQMPLLPLSRQSQYYEFCRKVLRDDFDYLILSYQPGEGTEEVLENISRFQTKIPFIKASPELAESLGVTPGIYIVRPYSRFDGNVDPLKIGTLTYVKYEGEPAALEPIYNWLEANSSPIISYVGEFDKIFPLFKRSYGKGKKILYVLTSRLNPYSEKYENLLRVFSEIAKQFQDQLIVAFIPNDDIASKLGVIRDKKQRLYGEAEVRYVDLNTLISTDPEPKLVDCTSQRCSDLLRTHYSKKYKLAEVEFTQEAVLQFLNSALEGTLPQYYEFLQLPKVNAQRLNAHNFKAEVLESDQHVLLEVYGKYCPACIAFSEKFDKLAGELKSPELKVAKLSIDQNQVPELRDKKPYTPIFWLYKKGAKDAPVQYTGPNNADRLREFVEAQLKPSS